MKWQVLSKSMNWLKIRSMQNGNWFEPGDGDTLSR